MRNLRVRGGGELRLGRRSEPFVADEAGLDDEKIEILRASLRRRKVEVGVFFGGVGATSSDDDLRRIAPNHPVFRLNG